MTLSGHTAEISNCIWNFDCSMIATGSIDSTARIWDFRNVKNVHVIDGHQDEVLDVCFDYAGKRLATASNDCTCKVWNVETDFRLISIMAGHSDEVSKVFKSFFFYKRTDINAVLLYTHHLGSL